MKISDLLRAAADAMDSQEADLTPLSVAPASGEEQGPVDCDNADNTDTATMIPPLQQKHELLKKVSDVANDTEKFDDPQSDDGSIEQAPDGPQDELDIIRQLTGMESKASKSQVASSFIADDHESD